MIASGASPLGASSVGGAGLLAQRRLPMLTLLNPRRLTGLVIATFVASLALARYLYIARSWKVWETVALVLAIMLVPGVAKWRDDARRYGRAAMVAGALVVIQGIHTSEHLVQWTQRHVLHYSLRASTGLLSPANSEWVHFTWNWLVFAVVVWLISKGMRNWVAWIALAWVTAHSLEHTYMWVRYLQVLNELDRFGVKGVTAQGLPGVVGQDGWLDHNTHGTLLRHIPFLTTATRLDTHAAWNTGEVLLLIPAIHLFLRRGPTPTKAAQASTASTVETQLVSA